MSKGFGKVFGSKEKQFTQPTTFETMPTFARKAMERAIATGQDVPTDAFRGADLTEEQQLALSTLASGLQPTSAERFQEGISTFMNPYDEQVVQSAIRDIKEAGAGQLSDIGTRASAAGGFGGTRQALLESELQRNIQRSIGDVSGQLRSQGFEAAAGRTLQDIAREQALAPELYRLGEAERQVLTQQRLAPAQYSQFLAGLSQISPTGGGQISFRPGDPGWLSRLNRGVYETASTAEQIGRGWGIGAGTNPEGLQATGSAAGNIMGGIGAMSDRRLKKNVKKVGSEKGFDIYEFDYIDGSGRFRGVMAQDVLKKVPEAVVTMANGYMGVLYDRIGLQMEAV